MEYFRDVCDKTIEIKSKRVHLQSLLDNELEKCKHLKHTIRVPDFFDIDEIFGECITNHNKNPICFSLNVILS